MIALGAAGSNPTQYYYMYDLKILLLSQDVTLCLLIRCVKSLACRDLIIIARNIINLF